MNLYAISSANQALALYNSQLKQMIEHALKDQALVKNLDDPIIKAFIGAQHFDVETACYITPIGNNFDIYPPSFLFPAGQNPPGPLLTFPCPVSLDLSLIGQKIYLYAMLRSIGDDDRYKTGVVSKLEMKYSGKDNDYDSELMQLSEIFDISAEFFLDNFAMDRFQATDEKQNPTLGHPEKNGDSTAPTVTTKMNGVIPRIRETLLRCVVSDYFKWLHTESENSTFTESQYKLGQFVAIDNVWDELTGCRLNISAASRQHEYHGDGVDWGAAGWELFRNTLDRDNEMFAYGVGPAGVFQRVSSTTRLEMARAAGLQAGGQFGGQSALGGLQMGDQRAAVLDQIENHAIVLPLGEGGSSLSSIGPYSVSFGWAIAPRIGLIRIEMVRLTAYILYPQ